MRCGIAAREAFSAVVTLSAYIRCQVLGSPSATVSKRKAAGDVDQRVELAEMRCRGIDRLLGLGRVGQVDAAEFEQICRGRDLRRRMVDAGDPGAARQRLVHDHPDRAHPARPSRQRLFRP